MKKSYWQLHYTVWAVAIFALIIPLIGVVGLWKYGGWTIWGAIQAVCSTMSALFAGGIALLQTFHILYDDAAGKRRLTPLGVLGFFLIIASGAIGLVANIANEYEKRNTEQTEKAAHDKEVKGLQDQLLALSNTNVKGFERVLQPIKEVAISYIVKIPSNDPECQALINHFQKSANAKNKNGVMTISSHQSVYPKGDKSVIAALIKSFKVNLRFWQDEKMAEKWILLTQKEPLTSSEQSFVMNSTDLSLQTDNSDFLNDVEIGYVPASRQLFLYYHAVRPLPPFWNTLGSKIKSVPDMQGATVLAYRRSVQQTATLEGNRRLESLLDRALIGTIIISVSGSEYQILPLQMRRYKHISYDNIVVFKFVNANEAINVDENARVALEDAMLYLLESQKNLTGKN